MPGSRSPANAGTNGVRPNEPVATTTLSQVIESAPIVATKPPSGPASSRSIRVLIRTGRSKCSAYFSRYAATSSLPGKCHGSSAGNGRPGRPSYFAGV